MYKRSALEKWNLAETKNFFTARNATVLLDLWERINRVENQELRQKLRFTFTAILPRASKRYQWSYKAPLNAAIQNYYIAPVFYEWNVYDLYTRKINAVIKSDAFIKQRALRPEAQNQTYVTASADNLHHLEAESVDFIFTDPPFGSNIFYSDMNLFHEAWLGDYTDFRNEAVMKTTGKAKEQSKIDYQEILTGAFREAYRVLRQDKCMAVVFGNSQGSIWSVVQQALFNSGFDTKPVKILILDKGQRSVKGLNSGTEKVATLDLIVVVRKTNNNENSKPLKEINNLSVLISSVFDNVGVRAGFTASHLYLSVLREAMHQGLCIANIDLGDILAEISARGFKINSMSGKLE
jgi:adenine-specific DNA methylase